MDNTKSIVLIADRLFTDEYDVSFAASNLEKIPDEYFYGLFNALCEICGHEITHYNSPRELIDNAHKHKDDIVFTVYGGEHSRNRMALIPAICESYHINFIGADTYARILCQDKYLSKVYCERFGLKTAKSFLLESINDIELVNDLCFPIILKPNMEGSSIGITEESIVMNMAQAISLAERLFSVHKQSIIAEEFIAGKEVSFYIVGKNNHYSLFSALEIYIEGDEQYFCEHLYSAEIKHHSDRIRHREITQEIRKEDIDIIKQIFTSLGKMDYMRIDCRLRHGELYLIELTPDAYIGPHSGFADIANMSGITYKELLQLVINTAYDVNQSQDASLK